MPMDVDFLNSKAEIRKNNAEYNLLFALKDEFEDRKFIVEIENLENLKDTYQDLRKIIIDRYRSFNIYNFKYLEDTETFGYEVVPSYVKNRTNLINYCTQLSRMGSYVLLKTRDLCLLYHGGYLCPDFEQKFYDIELITRQVSKKIPIQDIHTAFIDYQDIRKIKGWKEIIVDNKIRNDISEQLLRNDLIAYLEKNMAGKVVPEYCTSRTHDEESVDICVIDRDNEIVVIEVKYFIRKEFCVDPSIVKYSPVRFEHGYDQINRYCVHLKECGENIHAAFLYMFYADKKPKTKISEIADRYLHKGFINNQYPETKMHLQETVIDDMMDFNWG